MSRNAIGVFNKVFAESGDRVELPDFETGYGYEYQVDALPDRRHLNDVLAKLTALGVEINQNGTLEWNSEITYNKIALVKGSDEILYISTTSNNFNQDPSNLETRTGYWISLSEFLGVVDNSARLDALKTDVKFIAFTSHATQSLYLDTGGTYEFTLAGFSGVGLSNSDIREIQISWFAFSADSHNQKIIASYPSGQEFVIGGSYGQNDDDDCGSYGQATIPINKDQTSFKITLSGGGSINVTLLGAKQRSL